VPSRLTGLPLLEDLGPLLGKRVLVRVDFNVPLTIGADGVPHVEDDFRIRSALPTLEYLRAQGAKVTCCTHLGRPDGAVVERWSVAPIRRVLATLAPQVELLENLRFSPGEEANDPAFCDQLCAGFDAYVNDAFGVSHRAHASVVGPPLRLPSAAGRLLEREVEMLTGLLSEPARPFVAVVGGAKVADKLQILRRLSELVDVLVVGGGMAYTFLRAQGHEVGTSILDPDRIAECAALLAAETDIVLPSDTVALGPDGEELIVVGREIPLSFSGRDIGPESAATFAAVIAKAKTVLWNGPMGVFEDPRFAAGTRAVADAVAATEATTVVGGGDSVAALDAYGLADRVDHVSTGGGASLELIELGDLPGLAALRAGRPLTSRAPGRASR
jgi:phosphoglycerate kinase